MVAGASGDCYSTAFCTINTLSLVLLLLLLYRYFFLARVSLTCTVYGISKWNVEQLFCF